MPAFPYLRRGRPVSGIVPLDDRLLRRLAMRALIGLDRMGASMRNGSGDDVIACSIAPGVRHASSAVTHRVERLPNEAMTPLFVAVADASEEALLNSMFRATTVPGHQGTGPALPQKLVSPMLRLQGTNATP